MPISFKKMTIDNISDSTIIRMIRKICGIIDENNQNFSDAYDGTLETAQQAEDKAILANSIATEARRVAYESNDISTNAESIAEDAQTVANGIDAKASSALENSENALIAANNAESLAENAMHRSGDETFTGIKSGLEGRIINKIKYDISQDYDSLIGGYLLDDISDINNSFIKKYFFQRDNLKNIVYYTRYYYGHPEENYLELRDYLYSDGTFKSTIPAYNEYEVVNESVLATRRTFTTDPILLRTSGNQKCTGDKGFITSYIYSNNFDLSTIPDETTGIYNIGKVVDKNNTTVTSSFIQKQPNGASSFVKDINFLNPLDTSSTFKIRFVVLVTSTGGINITATPDGKETKVLASW